MAGGSRGGPIFPVLNARGNAAALRRSVIGFGVILFLLMANSCVVFQFSPFPGLAFVVVCSGDFVVVFQTAEVARASPAFQWDSGRRLTAFGGW